MPLNQPQRPAPINAHTRLRLFQSATFHRKCKLKTKLNNSNKYAKKWIEPLWLLHTNRFGNNKGLHRNSADCDRKNIHFAADRNIVIVGPDLQAEYPEIDLVYVIAFQTLSHLPESKNKSSRSNSTLGIQQQQQKNIRDIKAKLSTNGF